jgi:hypothetical protein
MEIIRFTVAQYQRMDELGVFGSEKVELLEGYIMKKGLMSPPKAVAIGRVYDELRDRVEPKWHVRSQMDITLAESQPQPDGAVVAGVIEDYAKQHPGAADVALAVEVADATLDLDRTIKYRIYARNRIPVYWIVNIPERQLEVYTQPRAGRNPTYRNTQILAATDSVTVPLGAHTLGPIPVADLLPPVSQP